MNDNKKHTQVVSPLFLTFVALFAVFIFLGSFMRFSFGPAVIIMQNALCILVAVLLGGVRGVFPVLLWLFAGLIGLPVFSGGRGGISVILQAWGGFYPGEILGSFVAGLIAGTNKTQTLKVFLALLAGFLLLYVIGVPWYLYFTVQQGLILATKTGILNALLTAMLPCLLADAIKLVICFPLALKLKPIVSLYL